MTYAQFLMVFLAPPVLLLLGWLAICRRLSGRLAFALGLTSALAIAYTGPWDTLIVAQGVWSYPSDRVLEGTIGLSRVEEYAFFVLQVLLVGLLACALMPKRGHLASGTSASGSASQAAPRRGGTAIPSAARNLVSTGRTPASQSWCVRNETGFRQADSSEDGGPHRHAEGRLAARSISWPPQRRACGRQEMLR